MPSSTRILVAALTRPINLLALGAGLLLALTVAPWWIFPASLVPYSLMVYFALRDPVFVEKADHVEQEIDLGKAVAWAPLLRELGRADYVAPLRRIAASDDKLTIELRRAPEGARSIMGATLHQLRAAAHLGVELARRLQTIDATLQSYPAANPVATRREAEERKRRADLSTDPQARRSLLDAAASMEESATSAEGLYRMRERLAAQLESLAASLESVAMRSIRLRVATNDAGGADVGETLRVDIEAVKETLSFFEETDLGVASARDGAKGNR